MQNDSSYSCAAVTRNVFLLRLSKYKIASCAME